ncbi:MAG: hypothetical protein HOH58_18460 [Opitutaceae bacterium]|nr:hypothetical protein [Opitutaceae bacterium]
MPNFYKPLLNIAGDWFTTLTRRRLQQKRRATKAQKRTLPVLLKSLARTTRGQEQGIDDQMSPGDFRQNIPLSNHRDLEPWIQRIKSGESNLLWPGKCQCVAATAGTTTGTPRLVPVTAAMQSSYAAGNRAALLHATARAGGVYPLLGRVLLLGGNVPTNQLQEDAPMAIADLATLAAVQHPEWIARHYFEPGSRIALRRDWDTMVERILKRTRQRDITLIAGNPNWLFAFAKQILKSTSSGEKPKKTLLGIWPNLRSLAMTGDFPGPIWAQLKKIAGRDVMLHEVFATTEAIVAAQGPGSLPGLRLLAETGVYYEFLPVDDYAPANLATLSAKAVPLDEVETEINYLLVLTTPAGLVRHVSGDVVSFTAVNPPRILPMGQIDLRLNTFGENLFTRDVIQALTDLCRAKKWPLTIFHVAPLISRSELGVNYGCHEWWIELRAGTVDTPTGPIIAADLDQRLQDAHEGYKRRRWNGNLEAPYVRLVMPGAFEHWLRHHQKWGGPHKLPITRNDREIADSLAEMARFAKD